MILRHYCQFFRCVNTVVVLSFEDLYPLERLAEIFMNAVITALGLASVRWREGEVERQCDCKKHVIVVKIRLNINR